jgi:malonyl-CoA O-methyltransferase
LREDICTVTGGADFDRDNCAVFLPGWGFDGRIIALADQKQPWLAPASRLTPAATLAALAAFLDQRHIASIVLAGWSLGAYLAIDFALLYPERIKALYLLATRQAWPPAEIEQIRAELAADPRRFLQTFYRKCFLGDQPGYRKFRATLEESYLADLDPAPLAAGLAYLRNFPPAARTRKLAELQAPIYILHGARDLIAPPAERLVVPGAVSQLLKHGGHPVFLAEACRLDRHRKKETLRRKFSRSAATYDAHATVQKEVAARLTTLLPAHAPATILETGCGTGNYTALLHERYPAARITALDFAENMLTEARRKLAGAPNVSFQCADAEIFLQENTARYELVTANATMHWFDNLEYTAGLLAARLPAGGRLVGSIFGPETMGEMQAGLNAVHGQEVFSPAAFFPDRAELQKIFTRRFSEIAITEWLLVRRYPNLTSLLRNISKTGTAGWHSGRHLLNRRQLRELEQWFRATHGQCRITYQIFMLSCRK